MVDQGLIQAGSSPQPIVFQFPEKQVAVGHSRVSVPYGVVALCGLLSIDETSR
jgi:hypothetical protein